eukprot:SAG31_NODE_1579_length_7835_cov_6.779860_5_plen_196_part_00
MPASAAPRRARPPRVPLARLPWTGAGEIGDQRGWPAGGRAAELPAASSLRPPFFMAAAGATPTLRPPAAIVGVVRTADLGLVRALVREHGYAVVHGHDCRTAHAARTLAAAIWREDLLAAPEACEVRDGAVGDDGRRDGDPGGRLIGPHSDGFAYGEDCHFLDFVGLFLLNLPYTHREIDCLLSRFHGTNRETRD